MNEILNEIYDIPLQIRAKRPLVHHITNYVTVNECANVVLAVGASPIMADDAREVEEVVALSSALVLNIGTLNERTVKSMLIAGKKANMLGIPVVFDPVGAGATILRTGTAAKILEDIKPAVIRGNMSEIKALSGLNTVAKGVDVADEDRILPDNLANSKRIAADLAARLGCVVAVTGAVDIVSDGKKSLFIHNGHPMLSGITGTGCMCTSLIGCCCAVTGNTLAAAAAGIAMMGIAGEKAYEKMAAERGGSGSFRVLLMDFVSMITAEDLKMRGKICEE